MSRSRSYMEEEIICPYDPRHKIGAIRMPRHLMRCRKNFPDVDMAVCPFNGFHEVPEQELRYHMEHCPDKALLDREMQLDFGRKRLKGCTDLPKSRSSELVADGDELWDEDPSEDRFRPQRNRNRDRRREEDTTKLRLPKNGGTAAQLASTLQVLEISDSQGCSDKEISKDTASGNRGVEVGQNRFHHSVNNKGNDLNANCNNNSSMSVVSPLAKQLSRLYHTSSDSGEESTPTNSPKARNNITARNKNSDCNTSIPPATGIASSRLEPSSIPQTTAQGNSTMRGLRQPQSAPKTPAFMLGRGRALPSFLSKSSVGTPDVGRQTLANCSEAAAQSRRLTELARSLGRGRGLCIRQASKQAA